MIASWPSLPSDDYTLLSAAVEAAANGILITDRDGTILWVNAAFTRMTGYTREEAVGKTTKVLRSGEHDDAYYTRMWETILAGETWQGETVNRRKDGSLYYEEQTITPVVDSVGVVTHFIAVKQDISERKQAELDLANERKRLYALLDELPAIVHLQSRDHTIRFANRLFRTTFGDPEGCLCYEIIYQRKSSCEECPAFRIFDTRQPVHWKRTLPDGKQFQIIGYPFRDLDGSDMVLELGIDITERTQMAALLEKTNQELLELSQRERNQRQLAESLVQATLAVNTSLELEIVLEEILVQVQRVVPYASAAIMLVDGASVRLARVHGIHGLPEPLYTMETGMLVDTTPLLRQITTSGQPVLIEDVHANSSWRGIPGLPWVRSFASVPMMSNGITTGVIAMLSDQPDFFTPDTPERLQAFAAHAVLAIQNARMFEQIKQGRERLQALSHSLVEIQENERSFIARELHDEAGQALTSLKLGLGIIERKVQFSEDLAKEIAQMKSLVEEVQEDLHRLAVDLRPAALDYLGLQAALSQYLDGLHRQHALQVQFEVIGLDGRLPSVMETAIYRIVQEAMTNVLRHARATRVDVLLEQRGDKLVVLVEDNGIGFNLQEIINQGRLGLVGLRERAEMLGGELIIESMRGKGTTVLVEVPYGDTHLAGG